MRRLSYELPLNCEIMCLGDTHIGSVLHYRKGLEKVIDYIAADPSRYWLHMGDMIEAIRTDDPRFDAGTVSEPIPMRQAADVISVFSRIADRGIVMLDGNHELKLHRYGSLGQYMADSLGIQYGTYSSVVSFMHDGSLLFRGFFWHGPASGSINSHAKDYEQRMANMRAAMKMRMKYKMGDCAVMMMGHIHKILIVEPTPQLYLRDAGRDGIKQDYLKGTQHGKWIDPDLRWYAATGSFYRLYPGAGKNVSSYAEIAGYDPVELGCVVVTLQDGLIEGVRPFIV